MMCNWAQKDVFEKSLFYSSPAHGGWGVLKIAQLVPGKLSAVCKSGSVRQTWSTCSLSGWQKVQSVLSVSERREYCIRRL